MRRSGRRIDTQLAAFVFGWSSFLPAVSQSNSATAVPDSNGNSQTQQVSSGALRSAGDVHFDIATGRVDGRVCLSGRPPEGSNAFSLNAGLNVSRVTDDAGKPVDFDGWYDPGVDGEARVYTLSHSPSTICISYVGAFPTYPAHDAPEDFKGLIAFNGDSVRATEQAVWLPTPFNKATKTRFSDTTYDLTMSCTGCHFIYMNGSEAVQEPKEHFTSSIPRAPLFFGGTGQITRTKAVTILNEAVPNQDASALSTAFQDIEAFYNTYMGQPVTDKPVLLRIIALDQADRDRRGSKWGFASWPTIALSGSIAETGGNLRSLPQNAQSPIALLSHETAHFYFGTLMQPHGPYTWFLLESTADFLSMKAEGPSRDLLVVRSMSTAGSLSWQETAVATQHSTRSQTRIRSGTLIATIMAPSSFLDSSRQLERRKCASSCEGLWPHQTPRAGTISNESPLNQVSPKQNG